VPKQWFIHTGLLVFMLSVSVVSSRAVDRLWLDDAQINTQAVHIALDTGSPYSVLARKAVTQLGLKMHRPSADIPADFTEWCTLTFNKRSQKMMFAVMDWPSYSDIDGLIGWPGISNGVLQVDYEKNLFSVTDDLSTDLKGWAKCKVVSNLPVLVVECGSGDETVRIGIDTGAPGGVFLNTKGWHQLRTKHALEPVTNEPIYTTADGLAVIEMQRVGNLKLGELSFRDVPVTCMRPSMAALFAQSDAVLGLFALTRMKIIVDGRSGASYVLTIGQPSSQYAYNRTGAVFVSKDPASNPPLVGHIIDGSPAYRAGIRDGDILLKVEDSDATNQIFRQSLYWSRPAGTKLKLTLRRGDKQYETTVTLEELPAVD
jgi:hypothetical protein